MIAALPAGIKRGRREGEAKKTGEEMKDESGAFILVPKTKAALDFVPPICF